MSYEDLVRTVSTLWAQMNKFQTAVAQQQAVIVNQQTKMEAMQNLIGLQQQQMDQMASQLQAQLNARETMSPRVQRAPDSVSLPLRPYGPSTSSNPLLGEDEQ